MENRVNTFDSQTGKAKKPFTWKKGILVFLIILAVIIAAGILIRGHMKSSDAVIGDGGTLKLSDPYIGVLSVEGTISESDTSGLLSSSSYHHSWILSRIDDMIKDSNNKGMILYVNSPGGSVYASDELYLAIRHYQKKTGRPVYSYMASEAASGGYYISSNCNRIVANRNCWTGSIGVTLGTMYDITGLLKKYGIRTVTITSGKNKAMGSSTVKMTGEQKKILQGLVDEAYEQFTGIVAEGRNMSLKKVRKLADGRIYTAKQAKKLGLVDQIGTYDEAVADMKARYKMSSAVKAKQIEYDENTGFLQSLLSESLSRVLGKGKSSGASELEALKSVMQENQTFTITYLSQVRK
ncbi:signal peptide peptidase SppA [Hornefia butyriciproducens]|uniref:signal peptide peptidase SppA n=1 Tax=Hornefia butyriciproducens TaxID=2652293 RepID=UPI002A908786|nr:signal peptide peptidase SppA [Hornefia butyriciproducens]MDY5423392.1 signal peptide peptidase SppA [Hornefia butyriciproducens]